MPRETPLVLRGGQSSFFTSLAEHLGSLSVHVRNVRQSSRAGTAGGFGTQRDGTGGRCLGWGTSAPSPPAAKDRPELRRVAPGISGASLVASPFAPLLKAPGPLGSGIGSVLTPGWDQESEAGRGSCPGLGMVQRGGREPTSSPACEAPEQDIVRLDQPSLQLSVSKLNVFGHRATFLGFKQNSLQGCPRFSKPSVSQGFGDAEGRGNVSPENCVVVPWVRPCTHRWSLSRMGGTQRHSDSLRVAPLLRGWRGRRLGLSGTGCLGRLQCHVWSLEN